jgi:acyl carrier protein
MSTHPNPSLVYKFSAVVEHVIGRRLSDSCPSKSWEQLSADSLCRLQITLDLEEAFGVSIPDDIANQLQTPELALAYVAKALDAKSASAGAITATPPHEGTPTVYGIVDPDYARVFSKARCLAWSEGFTCTMNGSFTRDLDLLLVPWEEHAADPQHLVNRIVDACDLHFINGDQGKVPSKRPHGRLSWTLMFKSFNDPRFIDVSVFQPRSPAKE